MSVDLGTIIAIGAPCIAGIVWMVRLEGRINVTDAHFLDIIKRLDRIENKQDRRQGPRIVENP